MTKTQFQLRPPLSPEARDFAARLAAAIDRALDAAEPRNAQAEEGQTIVRSSGSMRT